MVTMNIPDRLKRFEIPGRVSVLEGNGDLPKVQVLTDWGSGEIYLHGAHVSDFRKKGEPPLLFTSQFSRFHADQPIRGGVPIIFPWFGPREGEPMHGFARIADWELHEVVALPEGGATLRFSLPDTAEGATWSDFTAYYVVTLTDCLVLELIITNAAEGQTLVFENCLHTYFAVSDINTVSVTGLKGVTYLDKLDNLAQQTEANDALRVSSEVDRVYLDTTGPIRILDPGFKRNVLIEKAGSASTVVWNPWVAKSQQMPDFGNEEYQQMICVESGNVGKNKIHLPPGQSCVLRVKLSSAPL